MDIPVTPIGNISTAGKFSTVVLSLIFSIDSISKEKGENPKEIIIIKITKKNEQIPFFIEKLFDQ